jgi:hypothetical protein
LIPARSAKVSAAAAAADWESSRVLEVARRRRGAVSGLPIAAAAASAMAAAAIAADVSAEVAAEVAAEGSHPHYLVGAAAATPACLLAPIASSDRASCGSCPSASPR